MTDDRASSWPSTWAPADRRSGSSPDAARSLWWEHTPVADGGRARGSAHPGRRGVVDGDRRVRTSRCAGSVDLSRVAAVSVTGQWASTVPVDEHGTPGRRVRDVERHPRSAVLPEGRGRSGAGLRARAAGHLDPAHAVASRRTSGDDPIGHLLYLQHEEPDVVARTRWYLEPVDYLTMRFTGRPAATPGVDDRRLADRQPSARRPRLRRRAASGWPAWTPPGCRRWCRRGRSSDPCGRRSPPSWASRSPPSR